MSDTFREAIHSAGLEPPARIEPGRFHRFPGAGKPKGNRAGWCRMFQDGRGGVFGDWATGLHQTWQAEHDRPFTDQEREDFRRLVEEARRQAEELRQGERAAAAAKARKRENGQQRPQRPASGLNLPLRPTPATRTWSARASAHTAPARTAACS